MVPAVPKNYIPDFLITPKTGEPFFLEVKGWFRPEDRTKMKLVKRSNPDLDIRLLFTSDSRLYPGSETRYSDWCTLNGFPFCFKEIPKEWLN